MVRVGIGAGSDELLLAIGGGDGRGVGDAMVGLGAESDELVAIGGGVIGGTGDGRGVGDIGVGGHEEETTE